MKETVTLEFERETKRKYRFAETSDEPVMGTLYVSKTAFEDRPSRIEVTLRSLD